jgi:hypothetical protein
LKRIGAAPKEAGCRKQIFWHVLVQRQFFAIDAFGQKISFRALPVERSEVPKKANRTAVK